MLHCFFDGACIPTNPKGVAAYGFLIKDAGKVIHKDYGLACKPYSDNATNNYAEYVALGKAMRYCIDNNVFEVFFFGDSQLVVRQMNGQYAVRSLNIKPLYDRAKELQRGFKNIKIEWIRREDNEEADKLSKQAYCEFNRR